LIVKEIPMGAAKHWGSGEEGAVVGRPSGWVVRRHGVSAPL